MDGRGDLDTAAAVSVVRDPGLRKLPALIFAGGEPLTREDLFLLALEASSSVPFMILLTNGTLIDAAVADKIESAFQMCVVSLDGEREANDMIRGAGSYDMAVRGIDSLLRRRKNTKVTVACVVNRHDVAALAVFADNMRRLGVDAVKFQLNFLQELQPSYDEAVEGVRELSDFSRKHPGFIVGGEGFLAHMVEYLDGRSSTGCIGKCAAHIVISPSGGYSLCCYYPSELHGIRSFSDLAGMSRDDLHGMLADCPGCFRYDEYAMLSLLNDPVLKIRWRRVFENLRI